MEAIPLHFEIYMARVRRVADLWQIISRACLRLLVISFPGMGAETTDMVC